VPSAVNGRRLPFDIAGGRGLWSSALFEEPDALKETIMSCSPTSTDISGQWPALTVLRPGPY